MNTTTLLHTKKPLLDIQNNVSLADKNWFKTGGYAQFFCEPKTSHEFSTAIQYAHKHQLPITLLGHGANVLISDEGVNGLVIRSHLNQLTITLHDNEQSLVTAGAGIGIHELIEFCLDNQLIGLEEFSGIPGTVGGAIFINLHYFEFLIAQFLVNAHVVHAKTGEIKLVDKDWFCFGYNSSTLHSREWYLSDATFILKNASLTETAFARGRRHEIIRHRTRRYPTQGTCGSFFRNFKDHEVELVINNKKMIFVAYYLDKIGIKGTLRIGGAQVSHQHANMIVNTGNATSSDIITLARTMQHLVYQQFKIIPQPECELIGFSLYPLMQSFF